ncbi:Proteasome assembly chaperone 1 [Tupaia chinensis]|uniref:Proteasome assembly chaperone 1 n=1 Tax=Tupaia chinensis TaxID=246437 RepID=L9KY75_TUPCH|nr:Proteasome assembly chaperone 1 [Tupaia chinensis]
MLPKSNRLRGRPFYPQGSGSLTCQDIRLRLPISAPALLARGPPKSVSAELKLRRKIALWRLLGEVRLLRRQTKTSLEVSLLEKYPCSKFIIAIGNNAVAFLSSFVMNSGVWEEVGRAKLWNEWCRTTDTAHLSPTEAFCVFYHLKSNPSVLLCQCSCYVAEDQQYQWLEKVFGSCPKKNMQVTVLTCRHVTDYKTSESTGSLPSPFLKALKTQNFKDPTCCSLLEQPNIVHDLPAAVLSYCQVWKIPAVLYLCYTDVMKLDLITVEAFTSILSSRTLKGLVKVGLRVHCKTSGLAFSLIADPAAALLARSEESRTSFHPFADSSKGDDLLPAGTQDYIHLRTQQRNGRNTVSIVQGIADDHHKKKLVKKIFVCCGPVTEHPEYGEVTQLQGDQRKDTCQFLVQTGLAKDVS